MGEAGGGVWEWRDVAPQALPKNSKISQPAGELTDLHAPTQVQAEPREAPAVPQATKCMVSDACMVAGATKLARSPRCGGQGVGVEGQHTVLERGQIPGQSHHGGH